MPKKHPDAVKARALSLYMNGLSQEVIAGRLGIGKTTVNGWCAALRRQQLRMARDERADHAARLGTRALADLPPPVRYRIDEPVMALALSGRWA